MNAMQTLVRVPEVAATMREMSKEMMKVSNFATVANESFPQLFTLFYPNVSLRFKKFPLHLCYSYTLLKSDASVPALNKN